MAGRRSVRLRVVGWADRSVERKLRVHGCGGTPRAPRDSCLRSAAARPPQRCLEVATPPQRAALLAALQVRRAGATAPAAGVPAVGTAPQHCVRCCPSHAARPSSSFHHHCSPTRPSCASAPPAPRCQPCSLHTPLPRCRLPSATAAPPGPAAQVHLRQAHCAQGGRLLWSALRALLAVHCSLRGRGWARQAAGSRHLRSRVGAAACSAPSHACRLAARSAQSCSQRCPCLTPSATACACTSPGTAGGGAPGRRRGRAVKRLRAAAARAARLGPLRPAGPPRAAPPAGAPASLPLPLHACRRCCRWRDCRRN